MNLWTKAILIGVAIEGVLFALICGESGPCAPSSMGLIGILSHFPAMMLVWPLSGLDLPDWSYKPLLFAFGCLFWTLITYAFLVTRDRK